MQGRIDFAAVRAGVPIDAVLGHYGIESRKRNNTYLVANCPLPSHTSKESDFSFAVNVEQNIWTCHSDSCRKAMGMKGGDVIDLVCLMEGTRTPLDGAKKLVEWFPNIGGDGASTKSLTKAATANGNGAGFETNVSRETLTQPNKPLAFTLKDINPEHSLIQSRGITVETAKLFGVGFFPGKGSMSGRIVFPLYEQGNLVGYAGRTTLDITPENPKWRMPGGFVKNTLYGLDRCTPTKPLVVVEGPWGVLWLSGNGFQAAALMGKEMTQAQEQALLPFKTIQLALDDDEAGREATDRIAERLGANHTIMRSYMRE